MVVFMGKYMYPYISTIQLKYMQSKVIITTHSQQFLTFLFHLSTSESSRGNRHGKNVSTYTCKHTHTSRKVE
jgi:hypothetical protein